MAQQSNSYGPGPNNKGGGYQAGPKRWTGAGPAPARHVPWSEIFQHHISLIEGHLRMTEMVRKHTVEGTGNHRTIMGCVERTRTMLQEARDISRSFAPPPKQRERVPLGSSSDSMYPGYSPADHEYGKAAEEHGRAVAQARVRGEEIKPDGIEYQIGQGKSNRRHRLADARKANAAQENASGSDSATGSGSKGNSDSNTPAATNRKAVATKAEPTDVEGDDPFFVIDTKPTPVNLPEESHKVSKRSGSPSPEPTEGRKLKKAKKRHEGEAPKAEDQNGVQFEDISKEVDARMKEKEAKRKRKEEKKRKRESEGDAGASSAVNAEDGDGAMGVEKPKNKKPKHKSEEAPAEEAISKKRPGEDGGESKGGEGKKKKKRKI